MVTSVRDTTTFVELIKQIVVNVLEDYKLMDLCYGEVISEQPIEIRIDSKLILKAPQLIFTRSTLNHEFEYLKPTGSGGSETKPHSNISRETSYTFGERKTERYEVINRLEQGEKVLLLRVMGGQKYVVLDKEWIRDDTVKREQY